MTTEKHVTYESRLEDAEGRVLTRFHGLIETVDQAERTAREFAGQHPTAARVVVVKVVKTVVRDTPV